MHLRASPRERCPSRMGAIFLLSMLHLSANVSHAETSTPDPTALDTTKHQSLDRFKIIATTSYAKMALNGIQLNAGTAGLQIQYGLYKKIGFNFSLSEGFDLLGFPKTLYTAFDFRATYALTGGLIRTKESVYLGSREVYRSIETGLDGFRLQILAAQYLFHGSQTVVPLFGMGGSAYYEMFCDRPVHLQLGVRVDSVSNSKSSITAFQAFVGVALWL